MIAYFHVGRDPGDPSSPSLTTPQSISLVRDQFPHLKIVAAHLGGFLELDDAAKWVHGKDIYIDTCWSPNVQALPPQEVTQIIKRHGVDKVLFASDYPSTTNIAAQIAWLRDLLLTPEEQTLIFGENAINLLSI